MELGYSTRYRRICDGSLGCIYTVLVYAPGGMMVEYM